MFLAFDECEQGRIMIMGAVLMPLSDLPEFEKQFVSLRLKHKLFGEIKWTNISPGLYHKKYYDFIDLFFADSKISFHSISYRARADKYKAAYLLLRAVSWKLKNQGITNPLYVLFDEGGKEGSLETQKIKQYAAADRKFKHPIIFCNQGKSHILGILQISDLLCGAVSAKVNSLQLPAEKKKFITDIEAKNQDIPIDFCSPSFPDLAKYKFHHFDPQPRPKIKIV